MYDIYYIGDNNSLKDNYPFAKQINSTDQINPKTKLYWLIEPNTELLDYDVLEYTPKPYDHSYEHVWKWNKNNYGGVKLIPKKESSGIKEMNDVVCKKTFDILETSTPGDYFTVNEYATYVWCVDPEYKFDTKDINWAPSNFEPNFIHSFHLRGQLEHKYPEKEGGVKLFPRNWKECDTKYHNFLDANATYPVFYVRDVEDYKQRNIFDQDYVWLVDAQYKVNATTLDWVPSPFEDGMIHVFKMPYQLQEKYPMEMGGIRLVPKDWREAETKIHPACPVEDESYDVFYVDEDEFTADAYSEYADRSKTDWFWVVDREFTFNGKLLFVPAIHEREFIHVFKVPDMLQERYPLDNTTPWDNRCGGIRLVNKNFDMTKNKYQVNINPVKYDIFYTDNVNDYEASARKSRTKMFWLIDDEYQLDNNFKIVVPKHEQKFILNYQIDQLRHKYPEKEGGIYLIPKNFNEGTQIKYKGYINNDYKSYPIVKVNDIDKLSDITQDCWIVDNEYQIDEKINWAPSTFEKNSIHTFHVPGQLQHKYPDQMGGLRWVPLDWDGNYVIHSEYVTATLHYPILRVSNVEDLDVVNTDCWLIDEGYELTTTIDWAPPYFERNSIHVFHIGSQLRSKYPEEMGGMRWVPLDWNGEYVIHKEFLLVEKEYPVYFVDDPTTEPDLYESCWQADKLYKIQAPINWVPDEFDKDKIHVFHVYQQLTEKYTESMGGLYWYPANRTNATLKIHEKPLLISPTKYPVYFVDDPKDFSTVTEDCWLIDKEYVISDNITIVPWQNEIEKQMVHVYQVRGQLAHKYPEEMGGIYWVPASWKTADTKIHDITPFGDNLQFETYDNEETGRKKSSTGWFWVVDPDVTVNEDFEFGFIPKVWDNGKTHVWQKLNPITGKQYDYGGVSLCPKVPQTKGRPKYIRESCSTQKEYPVYTMTAEDVTIGVSEFYKKCAEQTDTNMFWVVDYCVELTSDFDFSYYPTQWDIKNVHVWQNEQGEHTDVRLCPTNLFRDNTYTEKEIVNNSFDNLKLMPKQASTTPEWNVYTFDNTIPFKEQLSKFATADSKAYFWTVDSNVNTFDNWNSKFKPAVENADKLHIWQKLNPRSGKVHAYGGVRLWPNPLLDVFKASYSSDDVRFSKTSKGKLHYVKDALSVSKQYNIVFLSYNETGAQTAYKRLTARFDATWIKDIKGIFNAHKEAAKAVNSDMFWVVDADADITEDFDFSYIPDVYDEEVVHVWASSNPVTGEEYGYGGVKLFNTEQVREATSWGLDFTTGLSKRFKSMPEISCVTRFNTDAYSTWRSAFRECVKLTLSNDPDSDKRLEAWLHPVPNADFRHDAKLGAEQGKAFALANKDNLEQLNNINDYDWLNEQYNKSK